MGIVIVAFLAARVGIGPAVTMTSTLRRTSSAASAGQAIEFSLCISPLNDNVFPLHVAKLAQTLPECLDAGRVSGKGASTRISYPGDFRRLLRLGHSHSKQRNEATIATIAARFSTWLRKV